MEYEKDRRNPSVLNRAVGESRTHTGLRPLPPQSSVYTISPLPQSMSPNRFGIAKIGNIPEISNFLKNYLYLCTLSRVGSDGKNH